VAASDETQDDSTFVALDRGQVGVKALSPRIVQAAPVVGGRACSVPGVIVRKVDILQ